MKLHKQILTENNCYKAGKKIDVKGLMLHSTGANNPKLSRYVGPDDGILGTPSPYHWNQPKPDGREVCVHGFIGKDKNGEIRTYQTLPWDHRGWGGGGSSNNTHIHVEICEGDLNDAEYFKKVYKEAVELFAYLCEKYNLTEDDIITHTEGHKMGIASNHADVMHWFPKHDKSMDTFRNDVRALMGGETVQTPSEPSKESKPTPKPAKKDKSIDQMAKEVIAGKHGSGRDRMDSLGDKYGVVQKKVNQMLKANTTVSKPKPKQKTTDQLANEVIAGKHGYGNDRIKALGSRWYKEVQARVNQILGAPKKNTGKSVSDLAKEVIAGKHGTGKERMKALGDKYQAVQKEVNRLMK